MSKIPGTVSRKLKPGIELRRMWRRRYMSVLDSIFEQCASNKILVGPDEAMDWMEGLLKSLVTTGEEAPNEGSPRESPTFRFDDDAFRREAHHYAVDRFYKTYFPRRRGAPPLPSAYLDRILQLRRKGFNYVAIAKELGQPKDRMRKQVSIAERHRREVVDSLKRQFPQFVHRAEPTVKGTKQRTSKQTKRQKIRRHTGK
jgi:hypothetical protein